jgi:hypothetical protein
MEFKNVVAVAVGDGIKVTFEVDGKKAGVLIEASLVDELKAATIAVPVVSDKRALAKLVDLAARFNLKEYSK